jgi:hypothetical protein
MICHRNHSYSEAQISKPEDYDPIDGTPLGGCPFLVEDVLFNSLLAQGLADMATLVELFGAVTNSTDTAAATIQTPPRLPHSSAASSSSTASSNLLLPTLSKTPAEWRSLAVRTATALANLTWAPSMGMHADLNQRYAPPPPPPLRQKRPLLLSIMAMVVVQQQQLTPVLLPQPLQTTTATTKKKTLP